MWKWDVAAKKGVKTSESLAVEQLVVFYDRGGMIDQHIGCSKQRINSECYTTFLKQ